MEMPVKAEPLDRRPVALGHFRRPSSDPHAERHGEREHQQELSQEQWNRSGEVEGAAKGQLESPADGRDGRARD